MREHCVFKPAYTREIERNLGNQEQGECASNQKDLALRDSETFPFWAPFPTLSISSHFPLFSVTEEELKKLLPNCKNFYV